MKIILFMTHNGVNWAWMIAGRTHAQKLGDFNQRKKRKHNTVRNSHDEDSGLKVTSAVTKLQETQGDDKRDDDVNEQAGVDVVW